MNETPEPYDLLKEPVRPQATEKQLAEAVAAAAEEAHQQLTTTEKTPPHDEQ